jgi:hypothetical protein
LDVQEKKDHDLVWRKRGALATRMKGVLREIDTEVAAIVERTDASDHQAQDESATITERRIAS